MDTARINELKDQICDVCHKMWQLGWVAATATFPPGWTTAPSCAPPPA